MSDFLELEYKYKADEIKLDEFKKLMGTLGFKTNLDVSSWDHYYTKEETKDIFTRFRDSSNNPELTTKIKVNNGNNWERYEYDLPLDPKRVTEPIVSEFVKTHGFINKTSIYKSCFIYWQDNVNYVYYIVYDKNLKELGRYIEVEVNKGKVKDLTNPIDELNLAAVPLEKLGITSQNRMKKSLYEIYVK